MIFAYPGADPVPFWVAPAGGAGRLAIMLIASVLLVGSFVRNPAFPHPVRRTGIAARARRLRNHPAPDELELHAVGAGPHFGLGSRAT
jgi:hypothetical protein